MCSTTGSTFAQIFVSTPANFAMIDWLEFNGTFSTIRLYRAFKSVVCILGNRNTLAVLYISYSEVDDQRH